MNELELIFPEGINTHEQAITYLAQWYEIKFFIELDGKIRVTSANVTKYLEPEAILEWGREWFDRDMERSREAAIRLAHMEEERQKERIAGNIGALIFLAAVLIGSGLALYIWGL